jgi:CelD/BcsL family acetyltransferase involved in cellulose biosynthesis
VVRPHAYQIELLCDSSALAALGSEWAELHARSVPRNPFLSWEWTAICWEQLCRSARPFLLTARADGRLAGIAPLCVESRLGFRVLRFIGDGRSDYLGFLHAAEHRPVERALLDALAGLRTEWDLAVLRQLSATYSSLPASQVPAELRGQQVRGTVAPYLAFDGDWDTLLKQGPGWLKRMAKASRKWLKDGGVVERLPEAEAARHVDAVSAVEARSWKGREGAARFQPGPGKELLRRALETLGARGEMELWLARKDGRPVAYEINFLTPERICLYQGAYDEEYRKWSPGGVLDFLSIERAWQLGLREYDFMSGDEPYKAERTTSERPLDYLALYPPTARGHLAYNLLVAPRWKLKDSAHAKAALQWWVRLRSSPAPGLSPAVRQ